MQQRPRPLLLLIPLALLCVASAQIATVYWTAPPPVNPYVEEEAGSLEERDRLIKAHVDCLTDQLRRAALKTSSVQEAAQAALVACEESEEEFYRFQAGRKLAGSNKPVWSQSSIAEFKRTQRQRFFDNAAPQVEAARLLKPRVDIERARLERTWSQTCLDDNANEAKQSPDQEKNFSGFCGCMSKELSGSFDDGDIAYGWTVGRIKQAMGDALGLCKPRFFGTEN